ncbi:hypothetical protein IV494_10585 [Kaistella sp. G5-32]|uniref:Uncharacterized protein n=1 Tax=Kaistella gelatinilytica TaxID=2787636 RepID=A0ABS0FD26_9FLAO|nr:hypothetical protein [Kaistella gelatinilytica]MBF8457625.1 hypothetical protein [Kaistella gelatinilytica]
MLVLLYSSFWPFYQFLWTIYFICMFLVGFWCIFMFFGYVIPVWLTSGLLEYFGKTKPFDPEEVRRKIMTEQEGVELLFSDPKGSGPFLHSHDNHGHH